MRLFFYFCILLISGNAIAQDKYDVYFDFNSDQPTSKSNSDLREWIKSNPKVEVTGLSGYADSVDANSYNKILSEKRIKSVQAILAEAKVSVAQNVAIKPYGENFELSSDQAKNRKVTIFYQSVNGSQAVISRKDSIVEDLRQMFKGRRSSDLVRIHNIHFYRNKEKILPESEPMLQQLYEVMVENPRLSIEIQGHICCNLNIYDTALSYRRAKYIFTYLLDKGIPLNRLAYVGFGSADPIYPIPETSRAEQAANRRVEILIIRN